MTNYIYDDDAAPVFPKGTIIHVSAWYDNTKANKNNPDPDQWVGYGDRTVDEMAHAWMNVVYLTTTNTKRSLAERQRRSRRRRRSARAVADAAMSPSSSAHRCPMGHRRACALPESRCRPSSSRASRSGSSARASRARSKDGSPMPTAAA